MSKSRERDETQRVDAVMQAVAYAVKQAELAYSFAPGSHAYHAMVAVRRASVLLDEIFTEIEATDG